MFTKKMKKSSLSISPKIILSLFVYCVSFALLLNGLTTYAKESQYKETQLSVQKSREIQENIADHVVRLHVIANSDSTKDQQLKLIVRDEIISSLQKRLKGVSSAREAKETVLAHQLQIQEAAQKALRCHNCDDTVRVSLGTRYFPIKEYGDLTFPAGIYQALCVEIGAAKGHNWWCVLFPSLCFVDETTATVPEESKEQLQEDLSEEAYDSLQKNTDKKPEIRSGLLDWFGK